MRSLALVLSSLLFSTSVSAAPGAYSLWPTTQTIDDAPLLAQKSKKKKKKKKYSDDTDEFGPADIEASSHTDNTGVGIHREQEGVDAPYSAEASLSTDLSFLSVEVEGADAISSTIIDIAVEWLFILGNMALGPDVRYSSRTSAVTTESINGDGEVETSVDEQTTSGFSVGGLFKWNFGNIDKDLLVPFGYGGVGYRSSETKIGDLDPAKSTGTVIRAGGGMNIFIDSNIAFNPRAEFRMETDQAEGENAPKTTTSGFKVLAGIAVFL